MNLIKLCLLASLTVSTAIFAKTEKTCIGSKAYCKILKLNPKMSPVYAKTLADKITEKAKKHNIDIDLSIAILQQESSLQNVITYKSYTTKERFCEKSKCFEIEKEVKEAFDLGIAQINIGTAVNYRFDLDKLFNKDIDYTLNCFFTVLKDKMEMCYSLGKDSFSCYHSINSPYRELYLEKVKRYL